MLAKTTSLLHSRFGPVITSEPGRQNFLMCCGFGGEPALFSAARRWDLIIKSSEPGTYRVLIEATSSPDTPGRCSRDSPWRDYRAATAPMTTRRTMAGV